MQPKFVKLDRSYKPLIFHHITDWNLSLNALQLWLCLHKSFAFAMWFLLIKTIADKTRTHFNRIVSGMFKYTKCNSF